MCYPFEIFFLYSTAWMLVNSRFPSSFVSKSGKFKKILGGGGGREGMPLKTLTFLFTEKKKKSKVVCIKKEIRARTAKHSLFWTLITEGTHNCNRFWIHVVKSVISSRPNAY